LATRFLVAFVAAALVPLVVVSVATTVNNLAVQQDQVRDLQREATHNVANVLDAFLGQLEDEMRLALRRQGLSSVATTDQEQVVGDTLLLDALLAYNDSFETLTLLDETGQEVAKRSRYTLYTLEDLSNRGGASQFQIAMREGRYLGPISISQYAEPLTTLSIPIYDVRGEPEGVLSAEINLKYMWDVIGRLEIGQGSYAYVVDNTGRLIAHRDSSMVLQGLDLSGLDNVRQALGGEPIERSYIGLEGRRVLGSYQALEGASWFVVVEAPTGTALAGAYRATILSVVITVLGLVLALALAWYMVRVVMRPLRRLQEGAEIIGSGDLTHRISVESEDEIGVLARGFNTMAGEVQQLVLTLEQRVAERTRGLQTVTEVAHATTSVLDPKDLLDQVVNLVRERFELYYVGLFLLDEDDRWAILRAGTGEAGQQMLAQGHRLAVGGDSMIGQSTAQNEARIALDVGAEAVHFDNPYLPETRSEMALPLRTRGRAIGALTIQSREQTAFDDADIAVMQILADQVAIAIDNAHLFAEMQVALQEAEALHMHYLGQAWQDYLHERPIRGYQQRGDDVVVLEGPAAPGRFVVTREEAGDGANGRLLQVPIELRGRSIGILGLERGEDTQPWDDDEVALVELVVEQFAQMADNLRLMEETRRRAAREQAIRQVTDRMRRSVEIETILQSAIVELAQAMGAPRAYVRLGTEEQLRARGEEIGRGRRDGDGGEGA
jgi:GAF domain-containing protein/HAMP domain-containing protein